MDQMERAINAKKAEIEKIKINVRIETERKKLQDAEDAYQATRWDSGNKLYNERKAVLAELRILLPEAQDQYDEDANVIVLLKFNVHLEHGWHVFSTEKK